MILEPDLTYQILYKPCPQHSDVLTSKNKRSQIFQSRRFWIIKPGFRTCNFALILAIRTRSTLDLGWSRCLWQIQSTLSVSVLLPDALMRFCSVLPLQSRLLLKVKQPVKNFFLHSNSEDVCAPEQDSKPLTTLFCRVRSKIVCDHAVRVKPFDV